MNEWYKKHLEIPSSVLRQIEELRRLDELYGNSIQREAKYMLAQQEIINSFAAPIHSSFINSIASFQPEMARLHELQLSSSYLDSINQANSTLATLLDEQISVKIFAEKAASINSLWKTDLETAKRLAPGIDAAASLALSSQFNDIAQASFLAQKRLLSCSLKTIESNHLYKPHDVSCAIDSFNIFTQSYESLISSFNKTKFNIIEFPPFVSGLPAIEILTSSYLLSSISENGNKDCIEEDDLFEIEIIEDIESSLEELICHINPEINSLWRGAKAAVSSTNPDKKRHVVVSLREMITHILQSIAPDNEVSKWTSKPTHYYEGRPTREARLLYVCREINHGPFEQFVRKDVESHLKFIRLFQRGTHELDINFTEQQLRTLIVRTEALSRFLLITWRGTK